MRRIQCTLLVFVFIIFGCDNPSEPVEEKQPYMTLNVGDMRQYYSPMDKYHIQVEVTGETQRSDGKAVYSIKESADTPMGVFIGTAYVYIEEGYFWSTELDTVRIPEINSENPFMESKIVCVYPEGGEKFLTTRGVSQEEEVYRYISLIDSLETPARTFYDVEECKITNDDGRKISLFYASGYGHVGTSITNSIATSDIFLTYIKIDGAEYGEFIHFADFRPENENTKNFLFSSFLN